jgi:hypothetical protein
MPKSAFTIISQINAMLYNRIESPARQLLILNDIHIPLFNDDVATSWFQHGKSAGTCSS